MKNVFKLFGIIALAAIIGFSMAGCKNDDDGDDPNPQSGGGLSAPYLTVSPSGTVTDGTTVYLDWTSIAGASRYNFYLRFVSEGQWASKSMSSTSASYDTRGDAGQTVQIKVAAVNSNGAEGAHSNVVSITVTGGTTQPQPNTSLNGTWEANNGTRITVSGSGSTGVLSVIGPGSYKDAYDKGYLKIGDQIWRNITSKGNLTWSGQYLGVNYNSNNVVTGVSYANNCTFTMSSNGQTLTITGTNPVSGANFTDTYTRR
jgi:hypothetical protein